MQKSNDEAPVASHTSPKATERLPLTKGTKTISDDTHFPGPLFPAVRKNDKPYDLRVSIDNDASSSSQGSSGFNERDWMYPSFLGPHMGRGRVKVKAYNKSQKHEFNEGNEEKKRIQELSSKKEEEKKEKVNKVESLAVTQSSSASHLSTRTHGLKLKTFLMFYLVSS